jgi:hypothetical protein
MLEPRLRSTPSHHTAPATFRTALVAFIACFFSCSHGPPTGDVYGKVTFKGQPVKEGRVTFLNPKEGGAAEALIGKEGAYAVPGVALGDYLIEIAPLVQIVDTDPGKSPPAPMEKPARDIPLKYRQQGKTPLRATVKQGKNEINFDMTP